MRFQDLGKRGVLQNLDPLTIQEQEGWNIRMDGPELQAHITMLANSIRELGVLEPLTVFMSGDDVVLTNGHCRLAAVKALISEGCEIESVPVRMEPKSSNDADRALSLITRNSGKPLAPIETAQGIKRLSGYGWSMKDISAKTGLTAGYIAQLVKLGAAPAEVQSLIAGGQVSASLASKVMRDEGPKAAAKIREAVTEAQAHGKKKVMPRNITKQAEVNWEKVGPLLKNLLIEMLEETPGAADRAAEFIALNFPGA